MKVYHGSYIKIDVIDLEKCEIGKDFGRGFYVTKIKEQAEFWAERRGLSYKTAGFVTEFDFNEKRQNKLIDTHTTSYGGAKKIYSKKMQERM